jgi:GlpG protein
MSGPLNRPEVGSIAAAAPSPPVPRQDRRWPPPITLMLCVVCVAVFVGLTVRGDGESWDRLGVWGYAPAERVWDGAYWTLVSSAFVHLAFWHLAFNVYWLWVFGGAVERVLGPVRYLGFVLFAAAVSSCVQLAASGNTGHGASGIVYALFGLMWASRKAVPAFAEGPAAKNAPLFWIWLIGCIVATRAGIADIGNGAHVGGLVFGLLSAHWMVFKGAYRRVALGATGLLAVFSLVSLFWCPWSGAWVGYKAYKAHARRDYDTAIAGYRRAIALGGQRLWALQNLALAFHAKGAVKEYEATLSEIRMSDPDAADSVEAEVGTSQQEKAARP